ncbi:MAG: KUP/HAK/KT family potassium transporter [Pirellulales bacterium]|nr:KUP/HAK/KT family potassium transporter [Pirellulales bacterium]
MNKQTKEQVVTEHPEQLSGEPDKNHSDPGGTALLLSSVAVLGIVFGDIGTSPLYAFRKCFHGEHAVEPNAVNVLGLLSLITWSLTIVISIKYVSYVMRADNRGEGGILALMALTVRGHIRPWSRGWGLLILGIFGAALLYGDGMITPAISVLSAVEGMKMITPALDAYVIPVTVCILFILFLFQSGGSRAIGSFFGPTMAIWFVVLAVLGIMGIVMRPDVLAAINPLYAVKFFIANGWLGALILGAVFLVVTGGEALYADIGHFGRRPVRLAWFALVFPALLANYFGQGALLLNDVSAASQPFYLLAPSWGFYPLLLLATTATVIASQAIISGVFSLSRQAVLLGYLPRLRIVQTSSEESGQVYIPSLNWLLLSATILLVINFKESINLAAAYGVAVSTTMVITTILIYPVI